MSDTDIFNADKQTTVDTTPATNELFSALVGEGKKYATVEELAKGYYNADNFMETLKDENRTLREQVAKVAELDAVLEQLKAKQSSTNTTTGEEEPRTGVSAEEVAKLVKQTLVEEREQGKLQGNLKLADEKLKQVFGDKAKEVFASHTSDPVMKQTLTLLAQQDPDKFVTYFVNATGGKQQTTNTSTVDGGSTVNTTNLSSVYSNREGDPETKEYYNALRQKNPSLYYSQEIQTQMNRAAIKNQAKFFGK